MSYYYCFVNIVFLSCSHTYLWYVQLVFFLVLKKWEGEEKDLVSTEKTQQAWSHQTKCLKNLCFLISLLQTQYFSPIKYELFQNFLQIYSFFRYTLTAWYFSTCMENWLFESSIACILSSGSVLPPSLSLSMDPIQCEYLTCNTGT